MHYRPDLLDFEISFHGRPVHLSRGPEVPIVEVCRLLKSSLTLPGKKTELRVTSVRPLIRGYSPARAEPSSPESNPDLANLGLSSIPHPPHTFI